MAGIFRVLAAATAAYGLGATWMDDYEKFNEVIDRWHQLLKGMAPPNHSKDIAKLRNDLAQIDKANTPEHQRKLLLALAPLIKQTFPWVPQDLQDAIDEKIGVKP